MGPVAGWSSHTTLLQGMQGQRHPEPRAEPGDRDHRACVLVGSGACSRASVLADQGTRKANLLEERGKLWVFLRIVTVGEEGKVRSVSAEGVSYQVR